ncbi:MAG: hypothetical protein KatS3mg103_0418 [Phycisphaerales bacterium]|nr:MAG: hypothetical protein KatS3mg103_0418 [Phycisphaerales bacterium]
MERDLSGFVELLDRAGELVRIDEPVDPVLEIGHLAHLASRSRAPGLGSPATRRTDPRLFDRGGPALLFTRVAGSSMPVLINAFGSYRRMELALGHHAGRQGLEDIAG